MSDIPRYGESAANAKPQRVKDLPGQAAFEGAQVAVKDLVGKSFLILKAKRLTSTKGKKGGPSYFYAVQAAEPDSGSLFTTLLGGVAVVPVIDSWLLNMTGPLLVTVRDVEGGDFGHYYVLE